MADRFAHTGGRVSESSKVRKSTVRKNFYFEKLAEGLKILFKRIIIWAETESGRQWNSEREKEVFEPVRVRTAGHHDSYTRTVTIASYPDAACSPGLIMIPAVRIRFTSLSNRTMIRILGK